MVYINQTIILLAHENTTEDPNWTTVKIITKRLSMSISGERAMQLNYPLSVLLKIFQNLLCTLGLQKSDEMKRQLIIHVTKQ